MSSGPLGTSSGDGSEALPEDSGDDAEQSHDLPVTDHTNPLHPIADRARPDFDPVALDQISSMGPDPTGSTVTELV